MKTVEFFYDVACPYAYLAHTQIETLCNKHRATLVWKPMLLGGVFQAIGAPQKPMLHMPVAKAKLNELDMYRWANHWNVPLHKPQTHPNRTVLAMRSILASNDIPRASKALFNAYWVNAFDVSDSTIVEQALNKAGFIGSEIVAKAETQPIKDDLRARTDEAVKKGVFGAPTMIVLPENELFWGQDRLDFVEQLISLQ